VYLHAVGQVDSTYVALAWVVVAFRIPHSAAHCTVNNVPLWFWLYAISAVALWGMVPRAAWWMFSQPGGQRACTAGPPTYWRAVTI
jgi:hypothetical protein